jgi:hypothetical protein
MQLGLLSVPNNNVPPNFENPVYMDSAIFGKRGNHPIDTCRVNRLLWIVIWPKDHLAPLLGW